MANHKKKKKLKSESKVKESNAHRLKRWRSVSKKLKHIRNSIEYESNQLRNSFESTEGAVQEVSNTKPLKDQLRSWVNCYGVSTRSVNTLLGILKNAGTTNVFINSAI